MEDHAERTAVLVGGSGLVGRNILKLLLKSPSYSRVTSIGRHELPLAHPKLVQKTVRFETLRENESLFQGTDLYCALGTTIKKAKTQKEFYKVDFTYPFEIAKLASSHHLKKLLLVSSLGADSASRVFYSRVKGELEVAVSHLKFEEVHLFRPSLLLGERQEARFLEKVAARLTSPLAPLLVGPLRKYRPIPAEVVAKAMVQTALRKDPGNHIHESIDLWTIAQTFPSS